MKKYKQERLIVEYNEIERMIAHEYARSPRAYLSDFYERKARTETSTAQWSIIITFIINIAWQSFAALVLFPILNSSAIEDAQVLCITLAAFSIFIALMSVAAVLMIYSLKRIDKKRILLEEHILKEKGIIE